MKFASSQTNFERSTAIGVIAECTANMGAGVSSFTPVLLKLLLHRLSDEDPETKSNAAYATGLLVFHSTDSATYLPSYNNILSKLEPLLQTQRARTLDNACGCVSRMIMAHQDKVPVDDIMPVLVGLLPLKEDFEENKPIFDCITGLCKYPEMTSEDARLIEQMNTRTRPSLGLRSSSSRFSQLSWANPKTNWKMTLGTRLSPLLGSLLQRTGLWLMAMRF